MHLIAKPCIERHFDCSSNLLAFGPAQSGFVSGERIGRRNGVFS